MKFASFTAQWFIPTMLLSSALIVGYATPIVAQSLPRAQSSAVEFNAQVLNQFGFDLSYPNSSQRFFEAGQEQLNQDIESLLNLESTEPPVLMIQPEIQAAIEDLDCITWDAAGFCQGLIPAESPTD